MPLTTSAICSRWRSLSLKSIWVVAAGIVLSIASSAIPDLPAIRYRTAIEPQFDLAGDFHQGIARVGFGKNPKDSNDLYGWDTTIDRYGYIDTTGKLIIAAKYADAADFSEGLAAVRVDKKYGYIDRTGKTILPPQFDRAGKFSGGLAFALQLRRMSKNIPIFTTGYIDRAGKFVIINPKLDTGMVGEFGEGLAAVDLSSGACGAAAYCAFGYIDRRGKLVIPTKFVRAGKFAGGLAPVATGGGGRDAGGFYAATDWGFIDKGGKFIIAPQFQAASSFSEGLAKVKINGKYGYIKLQ